MILRRVLRFLLLAFAVANAANAASAQQSLTADQIMARVAANQDRSEQLRSRYVYKQHIHITSHKTNGQLMREETTDYQVIPGPWSSEKKLDSLVGRYWHKGKYLEFKGEPVPEPDTLDGGLIHDFREDLMAGPSKDGIGRDLFPLTSDQQKTFQFHLTGEETMQGRSVYHIAFGPKDKKDIDWAGEAFIDKEEFQPVMVFTKLSRKMPFFIGTIMGINLPGIGFNVQYARQPDGVWFPESFGAEFGIHVLHLVSRNVAISMKNWEFKKTHVESKIKVPTQ